MIPSIKYTTLLLLTVISFLFANGNGNGNLCPSFSHCFCQERADKMSILCSIFNKFGMLPKLFHFLNFKPVRFMKLGNCTSEVLGSNLFTRTSISVLVFLCPFRQLDIDSLSRIEALEVLDMRFTKFSRIPPAIAKVVTLKTLRLQNGHLLHIGNELHNLTLLSSISLTRNFIRIVDRDAFIYNTRLKVINLSYNRIKKLDPGILRFCKYITVFIVKYNQLKSIGGVLKDQHSLQIVNLRRNKFQSLEKVFESFMSLEVVDAGRNHLRFLPETVFPQTDTQTIKHLYLDSCKLSILSPKLIHSLIYLEEIDLSFNEIFNMPEIFFSDLKYLRKVNLAYNKLMTVDNIFEKNYALESVSLYRNDIKYLGNAFLFKGALKELSLARNHLKELKETELKHCTAMETLKLEKNFVSRVDKNAFINMKKLKKLSLWGNEISSLNGSLHNLTYLEFLDLSNNFLEEISENDVINLNNLKNLYLENNRLKTVDFAFTHLNNLRALKLQRNNLKVLRRNTFPSRMNLQLLGISENRWACDCRLLWLKQIMSNGSITYFGKKPLCFQPVRLRGFRFDQLSYDDFIRWPEECPTSCSCFCVDDIDIFIKVDCSGRQLEKIPSYFPEKIGELDLQSNSLTDPLRFDSKALLHLRFLNLERNFLKALNFDLPNNVKTLKLANNNFTRFFKSPPSGISLWTLSNNPWKCDCKTVEFRKWMLLYHNMIEDVNETRCGADNLREYLKNKTIIFLSETDLCPALVSTYILVSISILIALLFVTSSRLVYSRYHYHIKVWLYSRGLTWLKAEDERDHGKVYDAFISSADADLQWVMALLLPELENKAPFYTLFEPRRNMRAGEMFEFEKEMEEVTKSKRIIILLSQNYIENNFLMELFKFAFLQSVEEKTYRLILIIIGDLPPLSDIDQSLKAAIESTRCLRFDQKLFWEMLRFAMPKKEMEYKDREEGSEDVPMLH